MLADLLTKDLGADANSYVYDWLEDEKWNVVQCAQAAKSKQRQREARKKRQEFKKLPNKKGQEEERPGKQKSKRQKRKTEAEAVLTESTRIATAGETELEEATMSEWEFENS